MLHFPNPTRVFDHTRRAVHFWGHDSAIEWSFFVGEDALKWIQPDLQSDETGLLRAFDLNLALIQAAAVTAYKRDRKASYELAAKDFSTASRLVRRKWRW